MHHIYEMRRNAETGATEYVETVHGNKDVVVAITLAVNLAGERAKEEQKSKRRATVEAHKWEEEQLLTVTVVGNDRIVARWGVNLTA